MLNHEDNSIANNKKIIRQQIRIAKSSMTSEEKVYKSKLIFDFIENQSWFKNANTIMCYWSLPDEVITHDFCLKWMTSKTILLPKMVSENIVPIIFDGSLSKEPILGIEEPTGAEYSRIDMIKVIIVPGVAFDSSGNRMGRGKGYYDKFLLKTNALKIGVCFDKQIVEKVPTDIHDIAMDKVVSF